MKIISWRCIKLNNSIRLSGITDKNYSFISTEVTNVKLRKNNVILVKTSFGTYEIDLKNSQCNNLDLMHYNDALNYKVSALLCKYAIYNAAVNQLQRNTKTELLKMFNLIKQSTSGEEKEFLDYAKIKIETMAKRYSELKLKGNTLGVVLIKSGDMITVSEVIRCRESRKQKDNLYQIIDRFYCSYDNYGVLSATIADNIRFNLINNKLYCDSSNVIFINKTGEDLKLLQNNKALDLGGKYEVK